MDLQKTQHYTTLQQQICGNLIRYIPDKALLIEPFAGNGDLLTLFPNAVWETYDVDPKCKAIVQDTLIDPPSYNGKWVITNPPYLAKNKATDKKIFELYDVDDYYKAALKSMLKAEGGILIVPANFFVDERTGSIRKIFLSVFEIIEINFFSKPVFETTTYSVCSFAFKKKENPSKQQTFTANLFPEGTSHFITIKEEYDYRIAGEFYQTLKNEKVKFGRLVQGGPGDKYITKIKLYALDTRSEQIRLEYCETPYVGKPTDRVYATFISDEEISIECQKKIIEKFNQELNEFREKFGNLSLTSYRDYNRKRIGFTMAYQLASKIYRELKEDA
jgi:hypothetical protein